MGQEIRFCQDERCLYRCQSACVPVKMQTVTTQTREGEGLWEKCSHCELVINRSGVRPDEVDSFYNKTYVEKNSYTQGELLSAREHFEARLPTVKNIYQNVAPLLKPHMRVMELGGATGELLYLMKDDVKSLFNCEINQLYTQFSIDELGLEGSWQDYFSLDFKEKFDFIFSINTIDHMYETGRAVEKIYADLAPGGYAYFEVPNDNQALRTKLPEPNRSRFEEFMYQRAHYYSFTEKTLSRLMEECGFKIVQTTTRHDYSLVNFLQWYFTGERQLQLALAKGAPDLFAPSGDFEKEMNELFHQADEQFKSILARHKSGELLSFLVQKV